MEYTSWWGPDLNWCWIIPFVLMILMFVCAIRMARRTEFWRCCGGAGIRGESEWGYDTPSQILDRRYASGEITKEEWEQLRRDLKSKGVTR